MKKKSVEILLVSILLLALTCVGQTQITAPPDPADLQVSVEILIGLMGKYMAMTQEYQDLIAQGGAPDSAIEFRLAATVIMADGGAASELDSVLTGISEMAFWVKASVFSRYPNLVTTSLSGSLGGMEMITTATEVVFISRDEAVFSVLPLNETTDDVDTALTGGILPEYFPPMDFGPLTPLGLLDEEVIALLLEDPANIAMEYHGQEATPKGMAHIVRLAFADTGVMVTLWVLDETWDLYKVVLEDPWDGSSAVMIIDKIELVISTLPDSVFAVDTTGLVELPYEDYLAIVGLRYLIRNCQLSIEFAIYVDLQSLPIIRGGNMMPLIVSYGTRAVQMMTAPMGQPYQEKWLIYVASVKGPTNSEQESMSRHVSVKPRYNVA